MYQLTSVQCTVGCNKFNNLVLPGHWWFSNLIKNIYSMIIKKFSIFLSRFFRVWLQSLQIVVPLIFFLSKMQYEHEQLHADLEYVENVTKKLTRRKVINEKGTDRWSFCSFITMCKIFQPITFCGCTFLPFFNGFNLSSNFALYDTRIKLFALFSNFKAKCGRNCPEM